MKKSLLCIILALFLVSCSQEPSESAIQTAIAKTNSAIPTNTSIPTALPSPTFTLTVTDTMTPTMTLTPTFTLTPTVTDTATPLPPETLTQQAIDSTRTEQAAISTSTQIAKDEFSTATANVKTKTAEAFNKTATEIASYESINWKELATYPNNYIGTKVVVRGRVFNVLGKVIQMYFAGTYEALYVNLQSPASNIYDNDVITVYGVVKGKECFTNAYGAEICQPALKDAWYIKP